MAASQKFNEVRDKAERMIRAMAATNALLGPSGDCVLNDACEIAQAWLAEHPAPTEEDGPESPPDLTFESVNKFVHESPHYEYLQWLCLSLAASLDRRIDDDEPVTCEWLASIGFSKDSPDKIYIVQSWGEIWLDIRVTGALVEYTAKTRGPVRRLLAALGVTLKEPS